MLSHVSLQNSVQIPASVRKTMREFFCLCEGRTIEVGLALAMSSTIGLPVAGVS
jgi:hypothetical protein